MAPNDLARVYRANSILTASPGQLVLLLYDGALNAIAAAQEGFSRPDTDWKRIEVINRNIRKAQRIISELRNTLNYDAGGEFAETMSRLYTYYNKRLLEANISKRAEPLKEVEALLGEIRGAWAEMLRKQGPNPTNAPMAIPAGAMSR